MGSATDPVASGNTLTVTGGTIDGFVFGGLSEHGDTTHNTVTINGGNVTGNVYGGVSDSSFGSATHNTVTINGGTVTGTVYGGHSSMGLDAFTGNTLNIAGRHTFSGLTNFEFFNFMLPADVVAGEPIITANTVNLGGFSTINSISIAGGGNPLAAGDTVTLIQRTDGNAISGSVTNTTTTGTKGMSLRYHWEDISFAGSNLTAKVANVSVNPQTHTLLQGRSAELALLTQGADMVAGAGILSMLESARSGRYGFLSPCRAAPTVTAPAQASTWTASPS